MTLKRLAIVVGLLVAIAIGLGSFGMWGDPGAVGSEPSTRAEGAGAIAEPLAILAGSFDATIEWQTGSGVQSGSGIETREMTADGAWLIRRLEGTLDGRPFHAICLAGIDPERQQLAGSWTDSLLGSVVLWDGTYSPEARRIAGTYRDQRRYGQGRLSRFEETVDRSGTGTLEISQTTAGGPSVVALRIVYSPRG